MSDTESFEYALWKAIDDCKIDESTDTITGSYTKSLSNQDRVVAAHIREIRDTAQQEYHRGFEAGTHSMDAEHRAIAMRLRQLPLDGGSVENVFNIAQAVYHNDFGWAANDCAALRDELVRLMGGVSDENVHVGGLRCDDGCMCDVSNGEDTGRTHDAHSNRDRNHMAVHKGVDTMIGDSDDACDSQCRGACAAGDCGCAGESKEVKHGGAAHDSATDSRGGSCGDVVHMDGLVAYDVLDNERRKAIAELRKLPEWYKDDGKRSPAGRFNEAIGDAIGVEGLLSFAKIRDRLIHLLGGDQPSGMDVLREMDAESDTDETYPNDDHTPSIAYELRGYVQDHECERIVLLSMPPQDEYHVSENGTRLLAIADRIDAQFNQAMISRSSELGCYKLHISQLEAERDELRAELEELRGHSRTRPKSCDEASESAPSVSITDELREWASDRHCKGMSHTDVLNIGLIADRIDEQFDRICQQQEAVLQSIIAEVVEERKSDQLRIEKLVEQRDEARQECADLLDLLRDARDEYKTLDRASAETSANFHAMRDRVWGAEMERDELQAKLDEYDRTHVELPKDADGKCIHSGDLLEPATLGAARYLRSNPFEAKLFYGYLNGRYGINLSAPLDGGDAAVNPRTFMHATPEQRVESDADTAESIVRDLSVGIITELQAVERIEALNG